MSAEEFPNGCEWQVQVPSGHPEPDSEADCWTIVDCGAKVTADDEGGWECDSGHFHEPIEKAWLPGSRTHMVMGEDW